MRIYGAVMTAISSGLVATELLWHLTSMEVFCLLFAVFCVMTVCVFVFAMVTEPRRKKKTRWVSGGGLDVMLMDDERK